MHDLGGQLTGPEREMKCSPLSFLNKSIVTYAVWHVRRLVETICHASQALAFWAKKVEYHLTVALTIHRYVTIRSSFEEVRFNDATSP